MGWHASATTLTAVLSLPLFNHFTAFHLSIFSLARWQAPTSCDICVEGKTCLVYLLLYFYLNAPDQNTNFVRGQSYRRAAYQEHLIRNSWAGTGWISKGVYSLLTRPVCCWCVKPHKEVKLFFTLLETHLWHSDVCWNNKSNKRLFLTLDYVKSAVKLPWEHRIPPSFKADFMSSKYDSLNKLSAGPLNTHIKNKQNSI